MIEHLGELILIAAVIISISIGTFLWSRRSLTINDEEISLPKDDLKFKSKLPKQSSKIKLAKKETNIKQKSVTKNLQKSNTSAVTSVKKSANTATEASEKPPTTAIPERKRTESAAEWTEVTKATKKAKKETKIEKDNSVLNDNLLLPIKESLKITNVNDATKKKTEAQVPVETSKDKIVEKVPEKSMEKEKSIKSEKLVTAQDVKEKIIVEIKPKIVPHEVEGLKQNGEIKENQKEETKLNIQSSKEMESIKQKLKISQTNEEKLLEDVKKKGQAVSDLKNQFLIIQKELTKNIVANQSLIREKSSLENRVNSLEEQTCLLNETCKLFDQLKLDNERLLKNCNSLEKELNHVKHESNEMLKSRESELANQIYNLQGEKQRMQDQLVRVQTDLIENNNKYQTIQMDLMKGKNVQVDQFNENQRLQKLYSDSEQSNLLLKQESMNFDKKIKEYSDQVACLKKQIIDIQTVNSNLSQQKSDLLTQFEQVKNSQTEESNSQINNIEELEDKIKSLQLELGKVQGLLRTHQTNSEEYKGRCENLSSQVNELSNERDNLIAQVDQYKTGLQSTELILSKLQTSVNEEENKWRESLMKSETELEKSKKELERVYNDLMRIRESRAEKNELNFAYHCVDKSLSSLIDEMEARMVHFEKVLENVMQERDNALAQITSQLNGLSEKHEENSNKELVHNMQSEIGKLKVDLDKQTEMNKTLESQCNKYISLIDIGKDALNEEQAHARELQEKIKSLQSCSTATTNNGEIHLNS